MTNLLFFIPPKLVAKLANKATEFVPVLGPFANFNKKVTKITSATNPISASTQGVGMLFNYCFGKAGAVTAECILWFGFSTIGGMTANPAFIAVGAEFGNMILDEFIE